MGRCEMKYTYRHKQFTAVFTDENGYFSLTGDVNGGSGACGDEIVKIDPRFKLMNDMHLCDVKTGAPMHAEENALYFAKQIIRKEGDWDIATLMRHLRVDYGTAKEFVELVRDHNDMSKAGVLRASESAQCKIAEMFIKLRIQWEKEAEDVIEQAADLFDEYEEEYEAKHADDFDWDMCDEPAKVKALSEHLECDPDDITESGGNYFEAHGRTYLVVDDDEADELWDEDLDNYIDDCLEIPENMKNYFDRDKFKHDAKVDGRGHSLGRYDGNENEVEVEHDGVKETYFIYRQ